MLLLLNGSDYLARFTPDQMHALAALFFDLHEHGLDNVAQWKQLALESASYTPCRFLDPEKRTCRVYAERFEACADCLSVNDLRWPCGLNLVLHFGQL